MTTMWGTDEVAIRTLMRDTNEAKLALPQFQRPSVWTKAHWTPFLVAVLRGRPTGTLLLLECGDGEEQFAPRSIDGAPDLKMTGSLKWLLLDGQQRVTTLYRAFHSDFMQGRGNKHHVFVIDVKAALERRELLEEDFKLRPKDQVSGVADLAAKGEVTLEYLYKAEDFENWKRAYVDRHLWPRSGEGHLRKLMDETMGGATAIAGYKFPVLKIEHDTPLDAVVDIFEGMNRRGQKLNQFDLMVARLYRELDDGSRYNLRDTWERELEKAADLQALGFDEDDGMLPLQLIAKHVSRLPEGQRPKSVRGLNNKDVLDLPPDQIIGRPGAPIPGLSLEKAVASLQLAAEFMSNVCGVKSSSLLPQKSMLIPLADQMLEEAMGGSRLDDANLKKWFHCVGLRGDYYGSVNSYTNADCDDLYTWARNPKAVPEDVQSMTKLRVEELSLTAPCARDGKILGLAVMALLVASGARDWDEGALDVRHKHEPLELHHMVPKKRLRSILDDTDSKDPIAGLTPISASANGKISDGHPRDVIDDLAGNAGPIMKSHRVDRGLLISGCDDKVQYGKFLKDRERQLKELIIETLGL